MGINDLRKILLNELGLEDRIYTSDELDALLEKRRQYPDDEFETVKEVKDHE